MASRKLIPLIVAVHCGAALILAEPPRSDRKPARDPGNQAEHPAPKPGEIDREKSRVYVRVGKVGFGHAHSVEGRIKSGEVHLNTTDASQKMVGQIEFDMATFSADSDAARKYVELKGTIGASTREQVTETLRGAEVLDVEEFPTSVFKIKSAELSRDESGDLTYGLQGELTLHGKTRPLTIPVEAELSDGKVRRLRCRFTILQSDFGMTPYKAALGTVRVADELKIYGDLWIVGDEPTGK